MSISKNREKENQHPEGNNHGKADLATCKVSKYLPKRKTLTKRASYVRPAFYKSESTRKKLKAKRTKERKIGYITGKLSKKEGFY